MARWLDYFQIWPKAYRFPKDGLKFFQILIQAIENCPKTCKIGQISPNLVTLYQARLSLSWRLVDWTVQKLFVNWTNMILFPFKLCQPNKQNIPLILYKNKDYFNSWISTLNVDSTLTHHNLLSSLPIFDLILSSNNHDQVFYLCLESLWAFSSHFKLPTWEENS